MLNPHDHWTSISVLLHLFHKGHSGVPGDTVWKLGGRAGRGIVGRIIIRQRGYFRHISTLSDLLNADTLIQNSLSGGLLGAPTIRSTDALRGKKK